MNPLVMLLGALAQSAAIDGPTVIGDPQLLQMLYSAIETAKSEYPEGQLRATVRRVSAGTLVRGQPSAVIYDTSVDYYWRSDESYASLRQRTAVEPPERDGSAVVPNVAELLSTPTETYILNVTDRFMRRGPRALLPPTSFMKLRPATSWYSVPTVRDFTKYFVLDGKQPSAVVRISAEGDLVSVKWNLEGHKHTCVADLSVGGRLVHFDYEPAPDAKYKVYRKADFSWQETAPGSGKWRLTSLDFQRARDRDYAKLEEAYILRIESFSDKLPSTLQRFSPALLKIPAGTKVIERRPEGERTYFYAAPPPPTLSEQLDRAASELRSEGFAAPD